MKHLGIKKKRKRKGKAISQAMFSQKKIKKLKKLKN